MPEGQKEAMTAQTFDEDEYKSNLIDNEDYSEKTAAMMAAKKKDQLATQAEKGPVSKMIEIDLNDITLAKAQREKMVTVRRGGKTFQRKQKVGHEDKGKSDEGRIKQAISNAQSDYDKLQQKMNGMIDKYYEGEKISPENKTKIDNVENQMKGVSESITSMRKQYERMTAK